MSLNLFSTDESYEIDIPDGVLRVYPQFLNAELADEYFLDLMKSVEWKKEKISLYGKTYNVPRLSAWYADKGKSYGYSGIRVYGIEWTSILLALKARVETETKEQFNSVLVNQYRNGADGVAWHSDDEPELGEDPIIASLSLGEERLFQLKHQRDKQLKRAFTLPHGSLLLMGKGVQRNWLHQIPKVNAKVNKSGNVISPRINLTFRKVL